LNVEEDKRVKERYKWPKPWKEEECRRPAGEGRRKLKVKRMRKKKNYIRNLHRITKK